MAIGLCHAPRTAEPDRAACVQSAMTDYTDDELSLMHLDGIDCPDDDHARELYAHSTRSTTCSG